MRSFVCDVYRDENSFQVLHVHTDTSMRTLERASVRACVPFRGARQLVRSRSVSGTRRLLVNAVKFDRAVSPVVCYLRNQWSGTRCNRPTPIPRHLGRLIHAPTAGHT